VAELKINLEFGEGFVFAHSVDLIGCYARAESKSEAIAAILEDSKKYCQWLQKIALSPEMKIVVNELLQGITNVEISQEVHNIPALADPEGCSALFNSEREELSQETFEAYLTIINKLPEELMRIVFQLATEDLERKHLPAEPSINDELKNLYQMEIYFMSKFGEEVKRKFFEIIKLTQDELESLSILERVVKVRQGAIALLRFYFPRLQKVLKVKTTCDNFPEEEWSLKKILRKFIEHERDKIKHIARLVEVINHNKSDSNQS